jgi:17beta-estradiol 17-dehydrogenase / very-long-chain 3-oxoacyl-CoA reductase
MSRQVVSFDSFTYDIIVFQQMFGSHLRTHSIMKFFEDISDSIRVSSPTVKFLISLGITSVVSFVVKVLWSTYNTFLRGGKNLKKLGQWAVITGATDGIGKAYAIALAKQGLSIVLISRTEAKLKAVEEEIRAKGYQGVQVKTVVCDYSKFDSKSRAAVKSSLEGLEIGLLINNVGVSYRYPLYFHELSDEEVQTLLTMNIDSTVWMTRMVLPGMIERKKGAIVNISSASALFTLPLLAEYSGAKSFVEKFSRALNAEYRSKGITCQCQAPFYVATKLAKLRKSLTVPSPTEFVDMAIKWIGYPDALVQPFWMHAVQGWVMQRIPDFVLASGILDMHLAIRKKGLKKDASLAEEAKGKKD